jgi:hypothetical protein
MSEATGIPQSPAGLPCLAGFDLLWRASEASPNAGCLMLRTSVRF